MIQDQKAAFLAELNPNLGIVHKICRVYFPYEPQEREDAFQEIMFQLWKAYPHFRHTSKFSTWLYSVALNTVFTHIRKTSRANSNIDLSERVADSANIEEHIATREDADALYNAIATLQDLDKAIVLLYLEGHTYEEIASITGLAVSNVSVRLVRLKRALRDKILHER